MLNLQKNQRRTGVAVLVTGLAAGLVNGLLGTGGGILIVLLLSRLYKDSEEYRAKDIFAMTVLAVFIMSFSALFRYGANHVPLGEVKPLLLPAVLGGLTGAFLLDKLKTGLIKTLFSLLILYAGVTLLLR